MCVCSFTHRAPAGRRLGTLIDFPADPKRLPLVYKSFRRFSVNTRRSIHETRTSGSVSSGSIYISLLLIIASFSRPARSFYNVLQLTENGHHCHLLAFSANLVVCVTDLANGPLHGMRFGC